MANPISFPEQNSVLKGFGTIRDLPSYRDGGQVISCWTPSPSELVEIMNTGKIWLISQGVDHPPIYVTGEYPFERVQN